jgi:lysyl-tRNA synthetase class 2
MTEEKNPESSSNKELQEHITRLLEKESPSSESAFDEVIEVLKTLRLIGPSLVKAIIQEKQKELQDAAEAFRFFREIGPSLLEVLSGREADLVGKIEEFFRRDSLNKLIKLGIAPYPHRFGHTHSVSEIVHEYGPKTGEELEVGAVRVRTAGRIHAINRMGKAAFIRFTDGDELLQIYLRSNEVDSVMWSLSELLHLGDFIGTEGKLFRTRTGELSVHAESLVFLAKALVPPPDKYYGLRDVETRYRRRYADLIANREVRRVFETRSQIIRLIRRFFDERGYIEVETPMLTPLPTGAAARPFKTHHNALDIDLYARIAPELYLKRLIVGGFEKVYEINRNFRNEGIDRSHNPEFTMLEWYEAYSEYEDLLKLTQDLISNLVEQICGKTVIKYGENQIDFTRPWTRMTMRQAIVEHWPHRWETDHPLRAIVRIARHEIVIPHHPGQCEICDGARSYQLKAALYQNSGLIGQVEADKANSQPNLDIEGTKESASFLFDGELTVKELSTSEGILRWAEREPTLKSQISHLSSLDYGHLLGEVFEYVAEPKLINPTFITEFPTELSPLSKQNQDDPRFVDRFELFIAGMEIANGFCEINDPVDQRQRFEAQMKLRERGDDEAMVIDEDYIRALSYGMPPTAGEGVGIDRLVMVLTNQKSIRDVILFPHMRPEGK